MTSAPTETESTIGVSLQIEPRTWAVAVFHAHAGEMQTPARVLIVDDDVELAVALGAQLDHIGFRCEVATSGDHALSQVTNNPFQAVVSDWRMGGLDGAELLRQLAVARPSLPVIVMTGMVESRADDAMRSGAYHYLTKPFSVAELTGIIEQAIHDREQPNSEQKPPRGTRDSLIPLGVSSRILIRQIKRLAGAEAPLLILGESGSGKELAARAIHARSRRSAGPFVALNVAAIPENLLESELFGHVRGAFSGATTSRPGLLLKANHGTLLLDEIGEMPLPLQAKLLRVIQSGEVRPVGSDQTTVVDVRFLAATHRDLRQRAREGLFREDLFFRLDVLELVVPSLRDRRPEIPGLVAHFLGLARTRNPEATALHLTPAAMKMLVEGEWSGNVRELASVVERVVVMTEGSVVEEKDLIAAGMTNTSRIDATVVTDPSEPCSLETITRRHVGSVLEHTRGDKVEAARILDVNLSTLYRWQRKARDLS